MIDPLEIWKSKKVTNLLEEFYEKNFVKAGVEEGVGTEIVNYTWENKHSVEEKELKEYVLKLFNLAKKQAHTGVDEIPLIDLFDLSETTSFLDYGSNKFRALNEVGYKYPQISELYAVDVTPQQVQFAYPKRSKYLQVSPDDIRIEIPDNSVDVVQIKYVLHHVDSDKTIKDIFAEIRRVLKTGGRLILWEEGFERNIDIKELVNRNNSLGIPTEIQWTKDFYDLSEEEKWQFIIANDWLINVNNPHMQWTGLYKEWEEWVEQLSMYNFLLTKKFNLGLRLNGQLKQGVHNLGIFRNN